MLIPPDEYESDETDHLLDQAIRAVNSEPIPTEPLCRAIETAVGLAAPGVRGESPPPVLERMLNMVRTHRRLSAAAALVVAAVAVASSLLTPSGRAYALDEIAKAHDRVTSYHVKITSAKELGEVWVELNSDRTPRRVRMDFQSQEDGRKVVILAKGKAEVWFKDKNSHLVAPMEGAIKQMSEMRDIADPRLLFEGVQKRKATGKLHVESRPPARDGEPVVLTATSAEEPDRRCVYEVDPEAKLVQRFLDYRCKDGKWGQVALYQFLDYNKPIAPQVFHPKMPDDVIRVDWISRKPGLVQGDLTDETMALKVTREYLQALIAGDYDRAGVIFGGVSGDGLKQVLHLEKTRFLRVVEIGKPASAPTYGARAFRVPVRVEVETEGKREVTGTSYIARREAELHEDRWIISGWE